jgi:hypothetical protein
VNVAQFEKQQARSVLSEEGLRLGTVSVQRAGAVLQEVWEDGRAFRELNEVGGCTSFYVMKTLFALYKLNPVMTHSLLESAWFQPLNL